MCVNMCLQGQDLPLCNFVNPENSVNSGSDNKQLIPHFLASKARNPLKYNELDGGGGGGGGKNIFIKINFKCMKI
jgi:hypothetical protein